MLRFDHIPPSRSAVAVLLRTLRALGVAASVGAALSGCGFRFAEPREPWRGQAEAACMRSGLVKITEYVQPTKPIDGPGPCGSDLPLKVKAFEVNRNTLMAALESSGAQDFGLESLSNATTIQPVATLGCPMVAWTDDWIAGSVQPAALAWFGSGVREIRTFGSYACRRRNHRANAKLSEHSFGNAIDVKSFVLNNGNIITVEGGWRGTEQERSFLRDVFHGACQRFKTALGPGSDALHYNHFHLDLAHHNAGGTRRYCKPVIAAPQRPLPGAFATPAPLMPPMGAMAPITPSANQRMMANGTPSWQAAPQISARMPAQATLPPRSTSTLDSGTLHESEPDFDPSQFDATGSIGALPTPAPPVVYRKPQRHKRKASHARAAKPGYDPAGGN